MFLLQIIKTSFSNALEQIKNYVRFLFIKTFVIM